MSDDSPHLQVGQLTHHSEFGEGVIASSPGNGLVSVLFKKGGEKQVEVSALASAQDRLDEMFSALHPATQAEIDRLNLAVEAESIPLMENKTELTSAKIDLLPHQVVLVHKVANANPRRFLIADEVGLGKTIETALILRELASRGELKRALIIVPAGLVENWRRELNDVFHLDFSVFGKEENGQPVEGNPFITCDRLIGSIDTLKRKKRTEMILDSPMWDLVVFDEAHHLTVRKNGVSTIITQNYILAEKLRSHCRDMLLLSATPHQGDNFRFLKIIELLNPNLFKDVQDMMSNNYRLNSVVIRRTKADSCTTDGGPLFSRRQVYSKCFSLSEIEHAFYEELLDYLERGYACEERRKGKKKPIGLVMSVFQKIASSSFGALSYTIKRRLVILLAHELLHTPYRPLSDLNGNDDEFTRNDLERIWKEELDPLKQEAEQYIKEIYHLSDNTFGDAESDYLFGKIYRRLRAEDEDDPELNVFFDAIPDKGFDLLSDEDSLDEDELEENEKVRLKCLLEDIPDSTESKLIALGNALRQIWDASPKEQIIIFATYLGSVELIEDMLKSVFPDKGVVVLKGGDHDAKINVQNEFKRPNGPQVLVCTAAGREGINLQTAKVLFNYDLPWNPMELEQRIGRIHRYGQKETAQVYNLVAVNTLEGRIFSKLKEKIETIARMLGKVDKYGQVTEDFELQILGFLQEELNYEKLYRNAIKDRTLKRTEQELDIALKNAISARKVVLSLFQDLDGFNLEDYQKCTDGGKNMARLVDFIEKQAEFSGYQYHVKTDGIAELKHKESGEITLFTKDRQKALDSESLEIFGLEHPIVEKMLHDAMSIPLSDRSLICKSTQNGIIVFWKVVLSSNGKNTSFVIRIAMSESGERNESLKKENPIVPLDSKIVITISPSIGVSAWNALIQEMDEKKILSQETVFSAEPLAVYYLQKNVK